MPVLGARKRYLDARTEQFAAYPFGGERLLSSGTSDIALIERMNGEGEGDRTVFSIN